MTPFYQLRYTPEASEGISKLPSNLKKIAEQVLLKISENPQLGKRLLGRLKGISSIRVTIHYRILYMVKYAEKEIVILDLKHRKEVYD